MLQVTTKTSAAGLGRPISKTCSTCWLLQADRLKRNLFGSCQVVPFHEVQALGFRRLVSRIPSQDQSLAHSISVVSGVAFCRRFGRIRPPPSGGAVKGWPRRRHRATPGCDATPWCDTVVEEGVVRPGERTHETAEMFRHCPPIKNRPF